MASAQEKFKSLLAEHIAPWLKHRGFSRRDATFRRERDGAWQIVNLQRSRYSDSRDVPFTVNLGVALALLHDQPAWPKRGWPLENECDFRERLGHLHKGTDHWWRVRPLVPLGPTSKDVLSALDRHGLPWLDLHADARTCLSHAVADLENVGAMNLNSLLRLAETIGSVDEVEAAKAECRRWQRGERMGNV